jgi:hypothetical protein
VHGTLEALAYPGEVLPPLPPEPDIPEELEHLREGDGFEEDIPVREEDLKASDDPVVSEEEILDDAGNVPSEETDGSGSDAQPVEPEKRGDTMFPEMPAPQMSEFLKEPVKAGEEIPPTR